jgi:hypothetical protein
MTVDAMIHANQFGKTAHCVTSSWEQFSKLLIFTDGNRMFRVSWMSSGGETIHVNHFSYEAYVQYL